MKSASRNGRRRRRPTWEKMRTRQVLPSSMTGFCLVSNNAVDSIWIITPDVLWYRKVRWAVGSNGISRDGAQVDGQNTVMSWMGMPFFKLALLDCTIPVGHLKAQGRTDALNRNRGSADLTLAGYAEHCWIESILPLQLTEPRVHTSSACAPIQLARTYTHACHPFIALTSAAYVLTVLRHPQKPSTMP